MVSSLLGGAWVVRSMVTTLMTLCRAIFGYL